MKKEVGVLLATFNQLSKPFLSKIVCYIWFHGGDAWSAWSDFPGLGCMNSCTGHNWNASPLNVLTCVTPLCEGTMGAMKWFVPWISVHVPFENMCPCGGIFALFATIRLFARVDLHVDSKPASLIARVVALWTNKRFLSAVNSLVGFQIGKFGTRLQL